MMSIKSECRESLDEDVESGQCSDDEIKIIKREKKMKKHKKKDKERKSRKRKHSNTSGRSPSEFFNPYCVNPGKFNCKMECFEAMGDEGDEKIDVDGNCTDIISETFNNLSAVDFDLPTDGVVDSVVTSGVVEREEEKRNAANNFHLEEMKKIRELEYRVDITGIDSVTSNLYHYLLDLGLSRDLVGDILQVYSKEENVAEEQKSTHDEDDGYEEEMINEIPIIDQGTHSEQYCGYSPERVNDLVETYKPNQRPNVAYSSNFQSNEHSRSLIDPLSIPAVGPRDPRLNQTKSLLQTKTNIAAKSNETINEPLIPITEINPEIIKEWEETVTKVVESHLKLYLTHKEINKEEYKSILKRAVCKILVSGEKKLETDKISKFVHSYVTMTQKSRVLNPV